MKPKETVTYNVSFKSAHGISHLADDFTSLARARAWARSLREQGKEGVEITRTTTRTETVV